MPIVISVFFIWLCFFLHIPSAYSESTHPDPLAVKGTMDLSKRNMDQQIFELNGEWEFYWGNLYDPPALQHPTDPRYYPVPHVWSNNGISLSNEGYATYRLRLTISEDEVKQPKAIYMPSVATSYKLWVNGVFQAENGKVGKTAKDMIPQNFPRIIIFQPKKTDIDIVIQVANFVQRKGGLWEPIRFGNVQPILLAKLKKVSFELFLIGSLAVIALYHFGLYFVYLKDKSSLYFACFALCIAIRSLLLGETIFLRLFPEASWEIAVKVEYWTATFGTVFFVCYVYELFTKEMSSIIRNSLVIIGLTFSFIILITPARIYTHGMQLMQLYIVSAFLYLIYVYGRAAIRGLPGSRLNLLAILILFSFILNDIFYYNQLIPTGYLLPLGLFFFIFGQAVIILLRFSHAFHEKDRLNKELHSLTNTLENRVISRTLELEESKQKLEKVHQELLHLEQSRRQLFSNISHDLRTPLTAIQGYLKAMLDGVIQKDDPKYLKLLYEKSVYTYRLLQDLLHLSKLQSKEIQFQIEEVPILEFINHLFHKYEWDIKSRGLHAELQMEECPDFVMAQIDRIRMEQVFSNLISNAVKFTPSGGRITVYTQLEAHEIRVEIRDTGEGISKEILPYIFQRYYKEPAPHSNQEGMGLGLAISKEIIEYHQGKIGVASEIEKGSTFYFTLPVRIDQNRNKEEPLWLKKPS